MDLLEKKINEEGIIKEGSILKVDGFLNQQIDIALFLEIGKEFRKRFAGDNIDKILTIESSGIGVAFAVSLAMNQIPVVFAKKKEGILQNPDSFISDVYSYTKNKTYEISVDKEYLKKGEQILIIDDFLANGHAALGLIDLITQAGATTVGIGAVIEKGFQQGRKKLAEKDVQVESLVIIKEFINNQVVFDHQV